MNKTIDFSKSIWFTDDSFGNWSSTRQLPPEVICDCSGQGDQTESVRFWVDRLNFNGPAFAFRAYLKRFGTWDAADLCDHEQNRMRVLWLWACDAAENPGCADYLYLA